MSALDRRNDTALLIGLGPAATFIVGLAVGGLDTGSGLGATLVQWDTLIAAVVALGAATVAWMAAGRQIAAERDRRLRSAQVAVAVSLDDHFQTCWDAHFENMQAFDHEAYETMTLPPLLPLDRLVGPLAHLPAVDAARIADHANLVGRIRTRFAVALEGNSEGSDDMKFDGTLVAACDAFELMRPAWAAVGWPLRQDRLRLGEYLAGRREARNADEWFKPVET